MPTEELLALGVFGHGSRLHRRITLTALLAAGSLAPRWIAFAQTAPLPRFAVTSVKPDNRHNGVVSSSKFTAAGFTGSGSLIGLIGVAYDLQEFQITGGPRWAGSDLFQVEGKADHAVSANEARLMLRALLEDRFKLKLRVTDKAAASYALVVAKGGSKLKPAPEGGSSYGPTKITGKMSLATFARILSNVLQRPVIDQTGLTGTFDINLTWAPDEGPSIFTASQEQLGLKIEPGRSSVDVYAIESAEKPAAN